jgi:hypothetical protein
MVTLRLRPGHMGFDRGTRGKFGPAPGTFVLAATASHDALETARVLPAAREILSGRRHRQDHAHVCPTHLVRERPVFLPELEPGLTVSSN